MPRTSLAVASVPAAGAGDREFAFSDEDFRDLAAIAHRQTGIVLADSKRQLVYSRLCRRLRHLGLSDFAEYRRRLADDPGESEAFINAISTNLTKFFREAHHFEHFRTEVAEPLLRGAGGRRRFRVWSAGCSTGEEPYSIAIVLRHAMRVGKNPNAHHDARVLATDIDTDVLARGAGGEYPADSFSEVPRPYRQAFGLDNTGDEPVTMDASLRELITFGQLNLIERWPMRGPFDVIFCRNVMIYFDAPTKATLISRFIDILAPGGFLYIGHSESLLGSHPGLKLIGRTIYRRDA